MGISHTRLSTSFESFLACQSERPHKVYSLDRSLNVYSFSLCILFLQQKPKHKKNLQTDGHIHRQKTCSVDKIIHKLKARPFSYVHTF